MSRADLACFLALAGIYVASREVLHRAGVQFDSFGIQEYWQILPVDLLQREPWTSLWYLHAQPPLFNALLALAFQLGDWPEDILRAGFAVIGISTLMLFFLLLRIWRVPGTAALAATAIVGMNPSFIGYEHWAFYTALEPLLVVAGAVAVTLWDRASGRSAASYASIFGLSVAALVLTRALFHPLWAAVLAVGVLVMRAKSGRGVGRAQLAWALLPCVVGLALMTKNAAVSGHFATSSWLGMNMSNMAFSAVPASEANALDEQGVITPLHRIGPFRAIARYRPLHLVVEPELPRSMPTGIAALDVERKASGVPNFNHLWYAAVSRVMLRDSLRVVRHSPARAASVFWRALQLFCRPTSDYGGIAANVAKIWPLEEWYRRTFFPGGSIGLVVATLVFALGYSVRAAWTAAAGGSAYAFGAGPAVYVAVTVLWVTVVGNLAEFGENNRFRFALDPLIAAVAIAAAANLTRRWRHAPTPTGLAKAARFAG